MRRPQFSRFHNRASYQSGAGCIPPQLPNTVTGTLWRKCILTTSVALLTFAPGWVLLFECVPPKWHRGSLG